MNPNINKDNSQYLDDEKIIELYWKREEKAIDETDYKYRRYLYTVAYNVLYDNLDCEECLNDTYLGTWNAIPPARPSVLQSFLSKIMHNIALDRYRKNTAQKRVPSELTVSLEELDPYMPGSNSVEQEYLISEVSRLLNEYLHGLDERSEFVFICRYYCADRISAIADLLNVSENTVSRELASIREGLRELLIKEGYFHE
jgi:RNA polymerase sigma-70 factor (ECF subfamily)